MSAPDDEQREAEGEQHVLHPAADMDAVPGHDEQHDAEQRHDPGAAERERARRGGVASERAARDERDGGREDTDDHREDDRDAACTVGQGDTALTAT